MKTLSIIAASCFMISLLGCASNGGREIMLANEERIIIQYPTLRNDASDIEAVAAEHCRKYGKRPVLVLALKEVRTYGGGKTLGYECRR